MNVFSIDSFDEEVLAQLRDFIESGGSYVTLSPKCPKYKPPFELPEHVIVTDLRFGGTTFIRGNHPRLEGLWTQYSHLETGLARNITFSQTITDKTPIENWQSRSHEMQDAPVGALDSEVYRHAHNHFQLLHSEVYNFSKDLNGVAIWGDSAALAPNAKSWGAFFSARSWPVKWAGYTPADCFDYDIEMQFDAALVGVEIDVLNAGKDWFGADGINADALAKVGLQVVGFGAKNTAAIEIRTEDSDDASKSESERRGAWHWGIIMRNALGRQSTVLMSENGHIHRGIDFDKTTFSDGALRISGAGPSSGIMFDKGLAGEIYSNDKDNSLNFKMGSGGLNFWSSDGTRIIFSINDNSVEIFGIKMPSILIRFLRRFTRP